MMKIILCIFAVSILWVTIQCSLNNLSDEYIENINRMNISWSAKRNFDPNLNEDDLQAMLGLVEDITLVDLKATITKTCECDTSNLPEEFDSRKNWKECPIINKVRTQGKCGSCWAQCSASVMSDRICIASKDHLYFYTSAQDLAFCTGLKGCKGDDTIRAFMKWNETGVVSGGEYESEEGCMPYSIPPRGPKITTNPTCDHPQCRSCFGTTYKKNKRFGKSYYVVAQDEKEIMADIYHHGPVTASFNVMTDFYTYSHGVYFNTTTVQKGKHCVKVFGWGVEDGMKYWHAMNSWGAHWGNEGTFKIKRGVNMCNFEHHVTAGLPAIK